MYYNIAHVGASVTFIVDYICGTLKLNSSFQQIQKKLSLSHHIYPICIPIHILQFQNQSPSKVLISYPDSLIICPIPIANAVIISSSYVQLCSQVSPKSSCDIRQGIFESYIFQSSLIFHSQILHSFCPILFQFRPQCPFHSIPCFFLP